MPLEGFIPNGSGNPGRTGGRTEYAGGKSRTGGSGRPQGPARMPDGSSKGLTPGESARVLRQLGMHRELADAGAGRPTAQPGTLEYAEQLDAWNAAEALRLATNSYAEELDSDENVGDA